MNCTATPCWTTKYHPYHTFQLSIRHYEYIYATHFNAIHIILHKITDKLLLYISLRNSYIIERYVYISPPPSPHNLQHQFDIMCYRYKRPYGHQHPETPYEIHLYIIYPHPQCNLPHCFQHVLVTDPKLGEHTTGKLIPRFSLCGNMQGKRKEKGGLGSSYLIKQLLSITPKHADVSYSPFIMGRLAAIKHIPVILFHSFSLKSWVIYHHWGYCGVDEFVRKKKNWATSAYLDFTSARFCSTSNHRRCILRKTLTVCEIDGFSSRNVSELRPEKEREISGFDKDEWFLKGT